MTPAKRNVEGDFIKYGHDAIRVVSRKNKAGSRIKTRADASYFPTGCDSGIERFEHGQSNSEETWRAASGSDSKWEDPEFGADDSSLTWVEYGFEQEVDAPPLGLKWKRPSEMGEGLPSSP